MGLNLHSFILASNCIHHIT